MTKTNRGRELIGSLPRDRILTETEGPFTQQDGRPTEPRDAVSAANTLADALGLSREEMTRIIVSNLHTLLG